MKYQTVVFVVGVALAIGGLSTAGVGSASAQSSPASHTCKALSHYHRWSVEATRSVRCVVARRVFRKVVHLDRVSAAGLKVTNEYTIHVRRGRGNRRHSAACWVASRFVTCAWGDVIVRVYTPRV